MVLYKSDDLLKLFFDFCKVWDNRNLGYNQIEGDEYSRLLEGLHYRNYFQWKKEEEVRKDLEEDKIVSIKRDIDKSNYDRTKLVEKIDRYTVKKYGDSSNNSYYDLYVNSETIGQLTDRISILVLKNHFLSKYNYNNNFESNITLKNNNRIEKIKYQLKFVCYCYDNLLDKIQSGEAFIFTYEQFKTYAMEDLSK